MTIKTLAIAAVAALTIAGSASAASINDENRLRDLSAPAFSAGVSATVFEGRLSQEPVGFSINDENLQRSHSAPNFTDGASGRIVEGRASANPSAIFINDENRDRFDTFER